MFLEIFLKKMLILSLIFVSFSMAADPTFSPQTLSDSVGNTADANSDVTWTSIPEGDSYKAGDITYDSQGMEPLYNFMRSFVNNAVFPYGFPYDTLDLLLDGKLMNDLTANYTTYLSKFGGYAACIIIGLLFIIFFTLVGCCFCCCRCCGNCGGKMMQSGEDVGATCKRQVFAVILLVLTSFTAAGMVCVYVSNDQFTKALDNLDGAVSDNIDDISTYLDNTVMQVKHIATTNFNFTSEVMYRDLDNIGYLVGIPVRTTLQTEAGVETGLNSVTDLETSINTIASALSAVDESITNVSNAADLLQAALNQLSNNISATNLACTNPTCPGTGPDMSSYTLEFDKSKLPNITNEVSQINSVKNQNLTALVSQARQEFDNIPWRVQNETNSTIESLKSTISSFSDKITPMIENIENIKNSTGNVDSIKGQVKDVLDEVTVYNKYRWYGGIGLTSIILLIVLLQLLGLAFGVCGHRNRDLPTDRGCLANSGGNMLMASVGFIFIFGWLLMLLTTLTFTIGSPMERFVCQPLTASDLNDLEKIIDTYVYKALTGSSTNGSLIGHFVGSSVSTSFVDLLRDCQVGKSIYTALQLDSMFNISQFTDYKSTLDIDSQLNSIDSNIDLSNFEILTPDLETQLNDFKSAVNINFTAFYDELNKTAMTNDLSTLSAAIRAYETTVASPSGDTYKAEYEYHANSSDSIKANQVATVNDAMSSLEAAVQALESAVNGTTATVDAVLTNLNDTQNYMRNNASSAIKAEATTYANRLFGIVDSYINDTLDALDNELGKCTPVWNLYNSLIVISFCKYSIDTLNGFWFALGWCLFFFVPSVIFSVKLAKHYRTMKQIDHSNPLDTELSEKTALPMPDVIRTDSKPMFRGNRVAHADLGGGKVQPTMDW